VGGALNVNSVNGEIRVTTGTSNKAESFFFSAISRLSFSATRIRAAFELINPYLRIRRVDYGLNRCYYYAIRPPFFHRQRHGCFFPFYAIKATVVTEIGDFVDALSIIIIVVVAFNFYIFFSPVIIENSVITRPSVSCEIRAIRCNSISYRNSTYRAISETTSSNSSRTDSDECFPPPNR